MNALGALGVALALAVFGAAGAWAQPATQPVSSYELRPLRSGGGASAGRPEAGRAAAPESGMGLGRVVLALGVVVAAIFALRWAGQRFLGLPSSAAGSSVIKVLTRSTLSPRQQLMLVQVGKRLVLVGNCGAQMNPLCEIADPDEVAGLLGQIQEKRAAAGARSFGALFGRASSQFEAMEDSPALPQGGEAEAEPVDPALATTRQELGGLLEKVRTLSKSFKRN